MSKHTLGDEEEQGVRISENAGRNPICKTGKETQMYRTDFWTLWEKARVGCSERTALKQVFETSAQGWCTGKTQRDGMERKAGEGIGMVMHVNSWLIHVDVWQKPLQYCKVISLQLIKINGKKKDRLTGKK